MRDRGTRLMAAQEFALGEPDAMAVDRAPTKQSVMVVDVEVPLALRKKRPDPGHFLPVLGDVRLHETVRMLGFERPGGLELLGGTRRRKAGRDRVEQPPAPVPAADQRLGLVVAAAGGIE